MSVKRSRYDRSSSSIETDLLNHISSPIESVSEVRATPPSTFLKPSKCLKPSMTSPVEESPFVIGEFLENCYFCEKKINHDEEVFMYSDLRAFCTPECRDSQIALDKKMEKQSAKSEVVTQGQMVNKLKG